MDPGALGHRGFLLMLFAKAILFRSLCVTERPWDRSLPGELSTFPPPCLSVTLSHSAGIGRNRNCREGRAEEEPRLLVGEMLSAVRAREMEEK